MLQVFVPIATTTPTITKISQSRRNCKNLTPRKFYLQHKNFPFYGSSLKLPHQQQYSNISNDCQLSLVPRLIQRHGQNMPYMEMVKFYFSTFQQFFDCLHLGTRSMLHDTAIHIKIWITHLQLIQGFHIGFNFSLSTSATITLILPFQHFTQWYDMLFPTQIRSP